MPCYNSWDSYLTPNTPAYERAKSVVEAKLMSIQHIIDYYYSTHRYPLPNLPANTKIDPFRQPRSGRELSIREMICHHFACDGINFCTLYDACTLLRHGLDHRSGRRVDKR